MDRSKSVNVENKTIMTNTFVKEFILNKIRNVHATTNEVKILHTNAEYFAQKFHNFITLNE